MNGNNPTEQNAYTSGNLLASWRKANGMIAGIGAVLILAGQPLVFRDFYYDILVVKYYYYCGAVILMAAAMLAAAVIFFIKDRRYFGGQAVKSLRGSFGFKWFTGPDKAMLAFLLAAVISTAQSDYLYESFWGNEGRCCGLFLLILYTVCFFIISKNLVFRRWYLDVFLGAGAVVCIIGLLHYLEIDPIGFKNGLREEDYKIFTSTIGNINTYTSYVALTTGVSSVLFSIERQAGRKAWYFICLELSFAAMITGISDNAYLALAALLGLLPLYLFRNLSGVKHYVVILAAMFTNFPVINFVENHFPDKIIKMNGIFNIIADFHGLPYLIILLWTAAAALFIADRRKSDVPEKSGSRWCFVWLGVIILAAAGILFVLYDANIGGNGARYGAAESYVVLDDRWGTNRGYVWRRAWQIYQSFPALHKLFGHGLDTFGILMRYRYYDEMLEFCGQQFESVHNEYLQYLVTIGIAGLAAYIIFLAVSIKRIIHAAEKEPVLMAIVFAAVSYFIQAAVNISVPLVAPVVMMLISIGQAAAREPQRLEDFFC